MQASRSRMVLLWQSTAEADLYGSEEITRMQVRAPDVTIPRKCHDDELFMCAFPTFYCSFSVKRGAHTITTEGRKWVHPRAQRFHP